MMRTMLDRLFFGRNGIDQLNIALLVLAALCPGTRVRAVLGGTVLPCTERAPGAWEVTVPHGLKNAVVELRPE